MPANADVTVPATDGTAARLEPQGRFSDGDTGPTSRCCTLDRFSMSHKKVRVWPSICQFVWFHPDTQTMACPSRCSASHLPASRCRGLPTSMSTPIPTSIAAANACTTKPNGAHAAVSVPVKPLVRRC